MTPFTTVFLSSTARDLQPHRDAVYAAISRLDGYHCVRMEEFGALDSTARESGDAKAARCDVYVGLIGHLYGTRPAGSRLSLTELEYEAAERAGKPRLLFLAADDLPLPLHLHESEEAAAEQSRFRERVRRERVVAHFREPQELALAVITALQKLAAGERDRVPDAGVVQTSTVTGSGHTLVQIAGRDNRVGLLDRSD